METVVKGLMTLLDAMNGQFGNKRLRKPYRMYWQIIVWGISIWMFILSIAIPFFGWWDGVISLANHVIWG